MCSIRQWSAGFRWASPRSAPPRSGSNYAPPNSASSSSPPNKPKPPPHQKSSTRRPMIRAANPANPKAPPMPVHRKTIEFAKVIAYDRHNNDYVYGGNWDPMNKTVGTDCSGCVVDELDAGINGTAMEWTRHGLSTESWRPPTMGGNANPQNGPFGTVM